MSLWQFNGRGKKQWRLQVDMTRKILYNLCDNLPWIFSWHIHPATCHTYNIFNPTIWYGTPPWIPTPLSSFCACSHSTHKQLHGQSYCQYPSTRHRLGYTVCFLAWFSKAPHEEYYKALNQVCQYLHATKSWGILYKWPEPLDGLPDIAFEWVQEDSNLFLIPIIEHGRLVGFLDAAHTTDLKTQKSITEYLLMLCSAAICLKESYPACRRHQLNQSRALCWSYLRQGC